VAEVFVGRASELALLGGLVTGLSAGIGGAVLVEGEQGIGKSSVLRAGLAGAEAAGCRVLWGAADELGQRFPLQLMTEIVADAGERQDADGQEAASGGVFAGDPVLAAVERLLTAIDRLCAVSPVVLVTEDLQWADDASVLVWSRLCRAVGQMPLLLVGSWRSGTGREELGRLRRGVAARGGSVIDLGPLPDAEVAELVELSVGGRPGRRLAALVGRSGGNPLYARELVDDLLRDGEVTVAAGVAELADRPAQTSVPLSLTAAIGERLDGLADDVVAVLRWAAVLGLEFSVSELEVVSGRSAGDLMGVIGVALGAEVAAEAGSRLRFRHALIRQVLYEAMPAGLRAALHLTAARALADAGGTAGQVAAQLAAARHTPGTEVPPWAVEWLAARMSALIYRAPAVAADLLSDALAGLPDTDPRREDLEAGLATVAFLLLRHDEVERVGGRLLARARDLDRRAEMAWLVGYTRMRTGRAPEAGTLIDATLGQAGLGQVWSARLAALNSLIKQLSAVPDRGESATESAVAEAERSGDRLALGYALHAMSMYRYVHRDQVGFLACASRGLSVIGDDPQATDLRLLMLANKVSVLGEADRQAEAIATAREALVIAERAGTPRLGTARLALADQYFFFGRWDEAFAEVEPAVGLPGPNYLPLLVNGLIAVIAAHREDWQTAQDQLDALPGHSDLRGAEVSNAHYMLWARAMVAEHSGTPREAATVLSFVLDPDVGPEMPGRYALTPDLARLALKLDDLALATEVAAVAKEEAEKEPVPVKAAIADHCRGLVTGEPGPVLAAAGYFKTAGRVSNQGAALEDAAVLAARRGEEAAARRALAGAMLAYEQLGASWDIRRASARMRPFGIRRRRGSYQVRPASGWAALTPTEVKVAALVARGRSNPDIATEMFLSRNTVQTHVSHILMKLDARSRAEIVREAVGRLPVSDLASA
jgi:DNA-binding CsgD family transcriptional regulator/tetratricopeptide (TPR) repeat protein